MKEDLLNRIKIDSNICYGRPVIGGKNRPLANVLNLLGVGRTNAQIIAVYDELEEEDIEACRIYVMQQNHVPDDIEAFEDAESGSRPYLTDLGWFAIDKNEEIAWFVTAGFGAIPQTAFQGVEKFSHLNKYLNNLPHISEYTIYNSDAYNQSYIEMAKRGIYAYDWNTGYGQYEKNNPYSLLVSPKKPLQLVDLDNTSRDYLKLISFKQIEFRNNLDIIVENHFAKVNV